MSRGVLILTIFLILIIAVFVLITAGNQRVNLIDEQPVVPKGIPVTLPNGVLVSFNEYHFSFTRPADWRVSTTSSGSKAGSLKSLSISDTSNQNVITFNVFTVPSFKKLYPNVPYMQQNLILNSGVQAYTYGSFNDALYFIDLRDLYVLMVETTNNGYNSTAEKSDEGVLESIRTY